MDAYSSYIIKISDARTGELRREAAEYALSAAARRRRRQRWAQALQRLVLRRPLPAPRSEGRSGPAPQSLPPQAWASNSSASSR
jgi:hypothetical protein